MRPKKYNFIEALQKLRRYCAYQERSHQEVKRKLYEWGFDSDDSAKVIVQLMEESLLNEERFAKAIAGGKFRQKGWGKRKITENLKSKGINDKLISISLKEIDPAAYEKKLILLLEKKLDALKGEHLLAKKQKLARFGISKGYEPELVYKVISQLLAA